MRADVFCNDNPIGTIDWTPDACGVQVNLDRLSPEIRSWTRF